MNNGVKICYTLISSSSHGIDIHLWTFALLLSVAEAALYFLSLPSIYEQQVRLFPSLGSRRHHTLFTFYLFDFILVSFDSILYYLFIYI